MRDGFFGKEMKEEDEEGNHATLPAAVPSVLVYSPICCYSSLAQLNKPYLSLSLTAVHTYPLSWCISRFYQTWVKSPDQEQTIGSQQANLSGSQELSTQVIQGWNQDYIKIQLFLSPVDKQRGRVNSTPIQTKPTPTLSRSFMTTMATKPNFITTWNEGQMGDKEFIVACKGRPFSILTAPQFPTPNVTYVDYDLVQNLNIRMSDLQCRKLSYCGQKLRILGKISTSVQCVKDGVSCGNLTLTLFY